MPRSVAKVYRSLDELLKVAKPDVIFHTAVSKVAAAYGQIELMVRHGISVVSSCEELLFPALREPSSPHNSTLRAKPAARECSALA